MDDVFKKKCLKAFESILRISRSETSKYKKLRIHPEWVKNPESFAQFMWQRPFAYHAVKMGYTPRRMNMNGSWIPENMFWFDIQENRLLTSDRTWK